MVKNKSSQSIAVRGQTMKHKKALFVILAAIAVVLGLYVAGNWYFSDKKDLKSNWNIVLPKNMQEEYSTHGEIDFQGHGTRYTVFKIQNFDASLLKGMSSTKDSVTEESVNALLRSIDADKNKYPCFTNAYQWKILSRYTYKLYIILDKKSSLLYFVQDIP